MNAIQTIADNVQKTRTTGQFDSKIGSPVPSPCISLCVMDEQTGWCKGCQRTLAEIARWSALDEEDKRAVWQQLALRRLRVEGAEP